MIWLHSDLLLVILLIDLLRAIVKDQVLLILQFRRDLIRLWHKDKEHLIQIRDWIPVILIDLIHLIYNIEGLLLLIILRNQG